MGVPATESIKLGSDAVKDISGGWTSKTLAVFRSEPASSSKRASSRSTSAG
jgi:hypothetical protein